MCGVGVSRATVAAWGENEQGQCNVPAGLNGVVAIAAGLDYTLAVQVKWTQQIRVDRSSLFTLTATGVIVSRSF